MSLSSNFMPFCESYSFAWSQNIHPCIFAAAARLFATPHEGGTGMDIKHMSDVAERSNGLIVSVETADVPQLQWRMDGSVKEFHLIAEPVKQEIVPGRVIDDKLFRRANDTE